MNSQQVTKYWQALNKWQDESLITSNQGEVVSISPVAFNVFCFAEAEALQLTDNEMNRVIGAWACTLDKEPPEYLFKN